MHPISAIQTEWSLWSRDIEDEVVAEIRSRGRQEHISFFAFTATPKNKTLELFGRRTGDGAFVPHHTYSMRQAIEEGFILDVLRYYTPVNEIFVAASFSALRGWWNECEASDAAFVRAVRSKRVKIAGERAVCCRVGGAQIDVRALEELATIVAAAVDLDDLRVGAEQFDRRHEALALQPVTVKRLRRQVRGRGERDTACEQRVEQGAEDHGIGDVVDRELVEANDARAVGQAIRDEARKGGLLSLEGKEVSSNFLQRGIQLLVDGHDPEVVKALLSRDKLQAQRRHNVGASIFSSMADVAPSMGMIGTLVGLVAMLANMDDPKAIGPAMAVALLTTLYGALIANGICGPIAGKLKLRAEEEAMNKNLIIDALMAVQNGQNPRIIDSMLRNYLPEGKREIVDT